AGPPSVTARRFRRCWAAFWSPWPRGGTDSVPASVPRWAPRRDHSPGTRSCAPRTAPRSSPTPPWPYCRPVGRTPVPGCSPSRQRWSCSGSDRSRANPPGGFPDAAPLDLGQHHPSGFGDTLAVLVVLPQHDVARHHLGLRLVRHDHLDPLLPRRGPGHVAPDLLLDALTRKWSAEFGHH